jgi:hypothetical protein
MTAYIKFIIAVAMIAASNQAFAGNGGNQTLTTLTWDQFQTQCSNPGSTSTQVAPQNIEVQCTNDQKEYVADTSGSVPLANSRIVTTALSSNKFQVESETTNVQEPGAAGSCLRYKEVEETFSIQMSLTCSDILNIKGDITDYCASQTALVKSANPKIVTVHDTGAAIDTCGALSGSGK